MIYNTVTQSVPFFSDTMYDVIKDRGVIHIRNTLSICKTVLTNFIE